MTKKNEPNMEQKPLTPKGKRERTLVWLIGLACLLLLIYIAWTLPILLLGIFVCTGVAGCIIAAKMIYKNVNGSEQNEKGDVPFYLYHHPKSVLGTSFQVMTILAAIACALFFYQWAVDSCYKNVATAYSKVNVLRDSLQKMPLAKWSKDDGTPEKIKFQSVDEAKACLVEILREIKLVDQEEFLKKTSSATLREIDGLNKIEKLDYSNFQNQDGVRWLAEHLFPDGNNAIKNAQNRFMPVENNTNNSTLRMIIEIAMKLEREPENEKQHDYFDNNVTILSDVFAGEPEAYTTYRNDFFQVSPHRQEQKPTQSDKNEAKSSTEPPTSSSDNADYEKCHAELFKDLSDKNFGDKFSIRSGFWNSWNTWFFRGTVPDDKEVLNLLFIQEQAIDKKINSDIRSLDNDYDATSNSPNDGDVALNRADILFIQQFCLEMLSKTHENPDVKTAKMWLSVFLGPEQFFMLVVFFLCFFTILSRLFLYLVSMFRYEYLTLESTSGGHTTRSQIIGAVLNEKNSDTIIKTMNDQQYTYIDYIYPVLLNIYGKYPSKNQIQDRNRNISEYLDYIMGYYNAMEQRSRWVINWAAVTLPAVGFIGTVRGMLLALGNADNIVRATTSASQAAAITDVASNLSLAFTTTLVALLLGLVITLLNYWQIKLEKKYLAESDRLLRSHFNVWNTDMHNTSSSNCATEVKQDQLAKPETSK